MIFDICIVLLFLGAIFGGILQVKNRRKEKRTAVDELVQKELMIFINYDGIKMSVRREELPMWNRMSPKEKSAMAIHHREMVRKGQIVKTEQGFLPIKLVRKDSTGERNN